MTEKERLTNILLSTKLGPVTRFCGIVNKQCECGDLEGTRKVWDNKQRKYKKERHNPGKHPPRRVRGWQKKNASTDPEEVARWCAEYPNSNFAVVTGSVFVVLDLDIRPAGPADDGKPSTPAKDGVAELARLETEAGCVVPPTITVLSGSGSGAMHLYFKIPSNPSTLQHPKGTTGIDLLTNGKACIVPGSKHKSGHYYEYAPGLSPAEVELAEIPDWLLEMMRKPMATATSRTETTRADTSHTIGEMFEELLQEGPPPGSMPPGRLRPDAIVMQMMKKVPLRRYENDTSFSDRHWAWTLARYCSHHWDQYLRIWRQSPIRKLDDSKCGRVSYERSILVGAFSDQDQQWTNFKKRPVNESANPALAKYIRKLEAHIETPRSEITIAVLQLNYRDPTLDDNGIAEALNETGTFQRTITREYVKRIRHRYRHRWRPR